MYMTHPDLGSDQVPAEVPEEAFEEVWAGKGWVRASVDPEGNPIPPTPENGSAETGAALPTGVTIPNQGPGNDIEP